MLGGFFMPKKVGRPRKSTTTITDTRVGENGRSKVWTFVVYPESIDKNWKAILDEEHIQWIESPLHDKDVNADGTVKKAHIHVMVLFSSVKTYEQVADLTAQIGATIPQRVRDSRAMARYFIHKDNPEKAQYAQSDIIAHGGADLTALMERTASENRQMVMDMVTYIRENNIDCYADFVDYCLDCNYDWFVALAERDTFLIKEYIKSKSWKKYNKPLLDASLYTLK